MPVPEPETKKILVLYTGGTIGMVQNVKNGKYELLIIISNIYRENKIKLVKNVFYFLKIMKCVAKT